MSNVPVLLSITEPDFKDGAPANTPTEPARKPLAKPKMEDKALSQRQHRKSIPDAVLWVSSAGSQAKGKVGLSGPAARPRAFEGWSVCQARQQDHPPARVPHTGILVPAYPKALHSPAWLDPTQHTGPTKLTSHRQPTPAKTAARLGQPAKPQDRARPAHAPQKLPRWPIGTRYGHGSPIPSTQGTHSLPCSTYHVVLLCLRVGGARPF